MYDQAAASKATLPRHATTHQDQKSDSLPTKGAKSRVQKACENCRKRKVRCSGERPQCQACVDQHLHCSYLQTRRDRLQEFVCQIMEVAAADWGRATDQNNQLIAFLKSLSIHVDDAGQKKIDGLLGSLGNDAPVPHIASGALGKRSKPSSSDEEGDNPGEAEVSGSVGSNDDVDVMDEDLFRSRESRATGFVGQNSEVQWLRSLKTEMGKSASTGPPYQLPSGPPGESRKAARLRADARHARHARRKIEKPSSILHVSDSTFYLDSDDLEVDVTVDPYELPPPETAERLFQCYMETVHTSFPILPDTFEAQFHKYNDSVKRDRSYQIPEEWQAMLNLVLAIGAQYSHLTQAEWRNDESDHLIYMTRATRILGFNRMAAALSAPTLSSIQASGLLSLYYLTIGQVSRAWMMIGISLRFALAVGLHLRNDDPSAVPRKKETLVKTWWSLHSIESLLCAIIGRPCIIPNDQCTVPLPQPFPDGQSRQWSSPDPVLRKHVIPTLSRESSSGSPSRGHSDTVTRASFLGARVTMGLIVQKALSKLYSARTSADSWQQIQMEIGWLLKELDEWVAAALPEGLKPANSLQESGLQRERLLLSFQYQSAKILICRPCLCRLERRIKGQTDASANFNHKTAERCVQAAQAMTRLFPEDPHNMFIYQQSPWWCIVHNIMQAMAVFLLEMSYANTHLAHANEEIPGSIKKLARWLQHMSVSNVVAKRAFEVVVGIIKADASRLRLNITDILAENKADVAESYPSPVYQPLNDSVLPSYNGNPFLKAEWGVPSSDYSTTAENLGIQHPAARVEQWPEQSFEGFQFDRSFMFEPSLQMPPIFCSPFFTDFDVPNPFDVQNPFGKDIAMNNG